MDVPCFAKVVLKFKIYNKRVFVIFALGEERDDYSEKLFENYCVDDFKFNV